MAVRAFLAGWPERERNRAPSDNPRCGETLAPVNRPAAPGGSFLPALFAGLVALLAVDGAAQAAIGNTAFAEADNAEQTQDTLCVSEMMGALSVLNSATAAADNADGVSVHSCIELLVSDFGDGPPSYGVAWHRIAPDLYLGSGVDIDPDTQGSDGSGDDDDGNNDEDGVSFSTVGDRVASTFQLTATVTGTNTSGGPAMLCGWLDGAADGTINGTFDRSVTYTVDQVGLSDPSVGADNEELCIQVPTSGSTMVSLAGGANPAEAACTGGSGFTCTLTWNPNYANTVTTYARFRLTTDADFFSNNSPSPLNQADDGEVEDYPIEAIYPPLAADIASGGHYSGHLVPLNLLNDALLGDGSTPDPADVTVDLDPNTGGTQTTFTDSRGVWTYDSTTGILTFTPASGFIGDAILNYSLTDNATGLSDTGTVTVTITFVTIVNNAPTDLQIDGGDIDTVAENQPAGTPVGTLTTTDPDTGDTHAYSLACATPGADDALFQINGSELQTNASFDYENPSDADADRTYEVCIRTTDNGSPNLSYDETITVGVVVGVGAPTKGIPILGDWARWLLMGLLLALGLRRIVAR